MHGLRAEGLAESESRFKLGDMAGQWRRLVRLFRAVAPWVLTSALVTVTLDKPLSAQVRHLRTFAPEAPTRTPTVTPSPRAPEPKTRGVTYEPWELVPT